jgi:hypothetical protein
MEQKYFRYRVEDKQYAMQVLEEVRKQEMCCHIEPTEENFKQLEQLLRDLYCAMLMI